MHQQHDCISQKPKPKQKQDPEQRCQTQIDTSLVTTQVAIRVGESGVAKIYAFSFALKYKTPSPFKIFKGGSEGNIKYSE
ncbi:hypothetical protein LUW10_14970 [Pseudomonas veronii]|uniref:hypothetical protein n=1 Tax=Pseudomonas veronii TaxID=76761 RepID=UPI001E5CF364|nr:hypothetical protein [Pseudomonas veronii]UHH33045.1 hypothetical protein LUW10_14970 [Pseudomonas veronii]